MNEIGTTVPPSTEMPITFLTLPRELRDEILTYAALSSSFSFLRTCHQLNEEGTRLLYKHGIYRIRALTLLKERKERRARTHLHTPRILPPIHLIQNLHITMPMAYGHCKTPNYEIPRSTVSLLEQFRGTEIRRRVCHFDLQSWTFSAGMAEGLGGLVGFEVVRVQLGYDLLGHGCEQRLIDERLGSALGQAKWERKESKEYGDKGWCVEVLIAEFRPWRSRS